MSAPVHIAPLKLGEQWADGPSVAWVGNKPVCATCFTSLALGSTVGPDHAAIARPTRVPLCPLGCGGAA